MVLLCVIVLYLAWWCGCLLGFGCDLWWLVLWFVYSGVYVGSAVYKFGAIAWFVWSLTFVL